MKIFALFMLLPITLNAETDNWREGCRKDVAAEYLNLLTNKSRSKDSVTLTRTNQKDLETVLKKLESSLNSFDQKAKSTQVTTTTLNARNQLLSEIKVYREQIASQKEIESAAIQEEASASSSFDQLHRIVKDIFVVKMVPDPEGLPQKIFAGLEWKDPCPKYRSLCPLPHASREALRHKLLPKLDNKTRCERYSGIR